MCRGHDSRAMRRLEKAMSMEPCEQWIGPLYSPRGLKPVAAVLLSNREEAGGKGYI
jgi:hypothetical protein